MSGLVFELPPPNESSDLLIQLFIGLKHAQAPTRRVRDFSGSALKSVDYFQYFHIAKHNFEWR